MRNRRPVSAHYSLLLLTLGMSPALANHADDSCPDNHISSGTELVPEVTVKATGQPVYDGMILPTSTFLLVHMRGTAYGRCEIFTPQIGGGCGLLTTQERLVNNLRLNLTAETTTQNGDSFVGQVVGKDPVTGTTAFYHELDSHDQTTSTGPLQPYMSGAGSYRYLMTNITVQTTCNIAPATISKSLTVYARDSADDENLGCRKEGMVGNPCNVATGNKYQKEVDRSSTTLPIVRHYNSKLLVDFGLGYGWLTPYHRRLELFQTTTSATIRARQGDGFAQSPTPEARSRAIPITRWAI